MKLFTRTASLLLALIMVVGMLASCGADTGNNNTPGTTAKPDDTTAEPVETSSGQNASEEVRVYPDLPDVRYDGYTYRVRVKGEATHWSTLGIEAETKTGDPINDATLERNNAIKDRYA